MIDAAYAEDDAADGIAAETVPGDTIASEGRIRSRLVYFPGGRVELAYRKRDGSTHWTVIDDEMARELGIELPDQEGTDVAG